MMAHSHTTEMEIPMKMTPSQPRSVSPSSKKAATTMDHEHVAEVVRKLHQADGHHVQAEVDHLRKLDERRRRSARGRRAQLGHCCGRARSSRRQQRDAAIELSAPSSALRALRPTQATDFRRAASNACLFLLQTRLQTDETPTKTGPRSSPSLSFRTAHNAYAVGSGSLCSSE